MEGYDRGQGTGATHVHDHRTIINTQHVKASCPEKDLHPSSIVSLCYMIQVGLGGGRYGREGVGGVRWVGTQHLSWGGHGIG